mmetsp:Transcript_26555/g.75795  ORF Transcript_26555/g.75795 Transcript_26555/m.75795 type:complete len:156 (+) Transcript_26555:77-544(+)
MSDLAPPSAPQARRLSQGSTAAVDLQAALVDQLQERRTSGGSNDDPLLHRRTSEGSGHGAGPSLQDWGGAPTWQDRQEVQPGIVVRNTFIDVEQRSDCATPGSRTSRSLSPSLFRREPRAASEVVEASAITGEDAGGFVPGRGEEGDAWYWYTWY